MSISNQEIEPGFGHNCQILTDPLPITSELEQVIGGTDEEAFPMEYLILEPIPSED
jgi:hypothetical protein